MSEIRQTQVEAPVSESPSAAEQHAFDTLRSLQVLPGSTEPYGDRVDQFIEWYGPEYGAPVTFVHGEYFESGADLSYARPAAFALGEAGYRVALVEYRRLAGHPELTLEDIRTLAQHPILGKSTWLGHSSGATLAINVLMDEDNSVCHAVALAPLFDLGRVALGREGLGGNETASFIGGLPTEAPELYEKFDPWSRYQKMGPEKFISRDLRLDIIHGTADDTVPVQLTRDLVAEPFQVAFVEDANHSDVIRPGHDAWLFLLGALGDPGIEE